MDFAFRFRLFVLVVVAGAGTLHAASREALATVVIFNKNDPASAALAAYYAERREIPKQQIVGLETALAEEISRVDYEKTIANPLRAAFEKKGWWRSVRFVATIRGIPLKIAPDPTIPASTTAGLPPEITSRNDASVDSELSTLGLRARSAAGIFPNPYFNRFTPALDDPACSRLLLVGRLDGPDSITVRAMIDDALQVEREGLEGFSYVDARGIAEGAYAEGDAWLRAARDAMRAKGLPVIFDNLPPTFPSGYPMGDAAIYYGWYAGNADGPFADPAFRLRPGSVAVHIHSFSAATLRSTTANWCGPLLVRGAAATLGNVYEPYLSLTANLAIFQDRLMSGMTVVESAYMAQRALSWMGVVVGDPLYRPYAAWKRPGGNSPVTRWEAYRRIVLSAGGDLTSASNELAATAKLRKDSLFLEALGAGQSDAGFPNSALASFKAALALAENPTARARIELQLAQIVLPVAVPAEPAPTPSVTPLPTEAAPPPPLPPAPTLSP